MVSEEVERAYGRFVAGLKSEGGVATKITVEVPIVYALLVHVQIWEFSHVIQESKVEYTSTMAGWSYSR